jgi:ATP phosphoribosyltransferase regulatory subunit
MPPLTALAFADLEEQARLITGVFARAGYELVAPAILQPASVFLDAIGEDLRGRTYVFTDPHGEELCLRPDLTVPTCLLYLDRTPAADRQARYAYNGACFRFQPGGVDLTHPREFRQAGIELFAAPDAEAAESEIVALIVESVRLAGLQRFNLRLGDLGIFRALLAAIPMPERWRASLQHHFWRPAAFLEHLRRLTSEPGRLPAGLPRALVEALDPADPEAAAVAVARHLTQAGIELQGTRTLAEITGQLLSRAEDARAEPLPVEAARVIEDYVQIHGDPLAAGARLRRLAVEHKVDLSAVLDAYDRRLSLVAAAGVDLSDAEFSAEFGRNLEYYTGFVFQIEAPELGRGLNIAGGGRYDDLLQIAGAPRRVPAVGASIHTERLLAIVGGGA